MLKQKKLLLTTLLVVCLCTASVVASEINESKETDDEPSTENAIKTEESEPKAEAEVEIDAEESASEDSFEDSEEAAFFEGITDEESAEQPQDTTEEGVASVFDTLSDDPAVLAARNKILPIFKTAVEYSDFQKFDGYAKNTERSVIALFSSVASDAEATARLIEGTAERLKTQGIPLVVLDTAYNDFFKFAFGVDEYPTLKTLHRDNVTLDYTFPEFDEDSINKYIARIALPRLCTAHTPAEIEALRDYPLVVGVFTPQDASGKSHFTALAEELYATMERFVLVESTDPELLMKHYNVSTPIFVIPQRGTCAPKDETGVARCAIRQIKANSTQDIGSERLYGVLSLARLPLIGAARPKTARGYNEASTAELWLALTAQRFAELRKDLETSAERHRDDIIFRWIDPKSEFASGPLESLHLSAKKDTASIRKDSDDKKKKIYLFGEEEAFTMEELEKFIEDYLADRLRPFLFSETLSAQEQEYTADKVGKLSARNIDAVVRNNTLRHIVLFTAPSCKRCRVYEQRFADFVAKQQKALNGYRWYAFDTSKNALPEDFPHGTFPVIGRFFGTSEAYYEGKWDEAQMVSFLNEPNDENQSYMLEERENEDEALEESEIKKEEEEAKNKDNKEKKVEEKKEL